MFYYILYNNFNYLIIIKLQFNIIEIIETILFISIEKINLTMLVALRLKIRLLTCRAGFVGGQSSRWNTFATHSPTILFFHGNLVLEPSASLRLEI
jgi:hypothetical protein